MRKKVIKALTETYKSWVLLYPCVKILHLTISSAYTTVKVACFLICLPTFTTACWGPDQNVVWCFRPPAAFVDMWYFLYCNRSSLSHTCRHLFRWRASCSLRKLQKEMQTGSVFLRIHCNPLKRKEAQLQLHHFGADTHFIYLLQPSPYIK